jgi:hypothetical protein
MMNDILGSILRSQGLGSGDVANVRDVLEATQAAGSIQFRRLSFPGNGALHRSVGELIRLRTSHPVLQRNEV